MVWRMLAAEPGATEEPVAGMLLGYLTMIVALTAVFLGVKAYRDKVLGGAIRFLPAFGVGLGISAVASIIYVIAWEISMAYSSFDFIAFYKAYMVDAAKAKGASRSRIEPGHRGCGIVRDDVQEPALSHAHDLHRDVPGGRADLADHGRDSAQQPRAASARGELAKNGVRPRLLENGA